MIQFNYETAFKLENEAAVQSWIIACIKSYGFIEGEISYILCDDEYLHKLNVEFLKHDTFTDVISFDYTLGKLISADIFISVERVQENAQNFNQNIDNELNRVLIHGILHCLGFKDKSEEEKQKMRFEEDKCLSLLNS
ncbi:MULTISPECIES: rRNA maturation RNase YbeY [Flavobacteriaceae]|uniref:Endoribonuclease YbeY n=2 Tax=Flavobacteriaceae TaxID=49546 RepID=A0A4Y8ARP4_9FLAO|nr:MULTISPECIES: rRNA maturation RNase YbeY [Flavobacteriaceae]TEW73861.1 rRNA maturation RNase YbeY [Gramella jeungdoensis]GGK38213.1 endoribonuclease YbeY [Lutibacter litoralis]